MKSNNLKRAAALGLAALMLAPSATFAKEFKDVKRKIINILGLTMQLIN